MTDQSLQARTASAIYGRGQSVTFSRWTGAPPNRTQNPSGGATVTAMVATYQPDGAAASAAGYGVSQVGSITEGDRFLIVMAADLTAAEFPLPVQKGDQIALSLTGETVTVTRADPHKRAIAGAIEVWVVGVA
jgi:hypothetical protein